MKNDALTVRILTPEGTLFEGAAEAVFLPGMKGAFEVLPGHAPLSPPQEPVSAPHS